MDNVIGQGLTLSIVGLLIAFAFMALFILTMVVLQAIFPPKKAAPVKVVEAVEVVELPAASNPAAVQEDDEELNVVAAVAAAIASLRSLNQTKLGEALAEGRGSWWMANRIAARQDSDLRK